MEFTIKHYEQLASTNAYAMELAGTVSPDEGTVIWADDQPKGIGHGGNAWESEAGKNLTFSLILKPEHVSPADQFVLTQMISLAIRNLVIGYLPEEAVKIKWPNDVYIVHDKVAGILIRNILSGNKIGYSVIGIGLNVNQEHFKSDAPNPVSLIHYSGNPLSVEDLLSDLLVRIDTIYNGLHSVQYRETLNQQYLDNLYRYKEQGKFREGKREFTATLEGIGEYGKLKLKTNEGKIHFYDFKEVEFVI